MSRFNNICQRYTMQEIHTIIGIFHKTNVPFELSARVLEVLSKLGSSTSNVANTTPITTTTISNNSHGGGRYTGSLSQGNNIKKHGDEMKKWGKVATETVPMKKVNLNKNKIDELRENIRSDLNKLSAKNYESTSPKILASIETISQLTENDEDTKKVISAMIFSIITTNKFHSSIYAQLYKEILSTCPFIQCEFDIKVDNYLLLFENIIYVGPDEDYNLYCKMNKENESRRAFTLFLIQLMNIDMIPKEKMIGYTLELTKLVESFMDKEEYKEQVNEISENLFVLIPEVYQKAKTDEKVTEIIIYLDKIKKCKTKTSPGLASKSIFQHMDMDDKIKRIK